MPAPISLTRARCAQRLSRLCRCVRFGGSRGSGAAGECLRGGKSRGPAVGVRDAAVLDAGDCVIERLRDGADAAAAHGAHVVSLNGDAHRRKPVWIVASDGRGNDIEGGVGDAVHAELRVGANDEGEQVKRRARLAGDPICLRANKGIHGLDEILRIEHGKAHPLAGGGKPFAVVDDAKQADVPVRAAIGLQTLENLSAVMKDAAGRMQGDLLQGLDACVVPPEARRIFHR